VLAVVLVLLTCIFYHQHVYCEAAATLSGLFLLLTILKDVVEAGGGVGPLAGQVGLKRPSLYKILSKKGNPTLETLQEILEPLGLRISVALDKAA